MKGNENIRQAHKQSQQDSIIRMILAILGLLSFLFSKSFGWGFILGAIVLKEYINLKNKKGWLLLLITSVAMILVIYFILEPLAILGYIVATILYFFLREAFTYYQNK